MKKKILAISILLLAISMLFILTNTVKATDNVAKIGNTGYPTLQGAITAAGDGATIELLKTTSGAGFIVGEDKNITIDFGGYTYTVNSGFVGSAGYETNGCQLLKNSNVTLKNGTLTSSGAKILVQNYSNLTVQSMTLKSEDADYVLSLNNGTTSIEGSTSITAGASKVAFDVYYRSDLYPEGTQVTVNTTGTITGEIEVKAKDGAESSSQSKLTIENINHNGEMDVTPALDGKVTVEGGSFTRNDFIKYVKNNGTVILVEKGDDEHYYVGTSVDEALEDVEEGSTITVEKGNVEISSLPDNVTVKTAEGATATVNGYKVTGAGVDTSVLNKLKVLEDWKNKLEAELKKLGYSPEDIARILEQAMESIANQGANIEKLQAQIDSLKAQYNELTKEEEESVAEEKDNTPKTGIIDVALVASVVAMVSAAGIVTVKKYNK